MTIQKQQHLLDQDTDKEKKSNSKKSRKPRFRAEGFLLNSRRDSARKPTKFDHHRHLISESKDSPLDTVFKCVGSIFKNLPLLFEAIYAQCEQIFRNGAAKPKEIKRARRDNQKTRGKVSVAKINPQTDSHRSLDEVEAALKKVVDDIGGFEFLSSPPQGKENNEHTVLIKVGVNWGINGYPTVTSWESVYAVTKMCLEEAKKRGAKVSVIVGDESGIENGLWCGKTMENFEHTKILHAAVRAGLGHAASLELADPGNFEGAGRNLQLVQVERKVTEEMECMAKKAGVEVIAFGDEDENFLKVPIPAKENVKHFKEGIRVPRVVAEEVTDIINLPKPPGRHLIMGNTGLTGALKNHVGLLKASDRSGMLHGGWDSPPDSNENEGGIKRLVRKLIRFINWIIHGPGMGLHEKIVEIYLAFKDKERFSVTDMRRTISSLGPDIGDTIDIGVVIAATDPATLDVVAGAFLKERYKKIGNWFDALKLGGDTFWEYWAGKTWLRNCTPFDLKSHIAANSYGIGPIDLNHIEFQGFQSSGFRVGELRAAAAHLQVQKKITLQTIAKRLLPKWSPGSRTP
jgi:uncharacterized protein (DUF362 family)